MKLVVVEQMEIGTLYYLADSTGEVRVYAFENKAFDHRAILTGCAFTEPGEAELSLKSGRKAPVDWFLMSREQLVAATEECQKDAGEPSARLRLLQDVEVKMREVLASMDQLPAPHQTAEQEARRQLADGIEHLRVAMLSVSRDASAMF